jgi:hypothetical protein
MPLTIDVLDAYADPVTISTIDALIDALASASPMYRIAGTPMVRPADVLPYDVGDSISNSVDPLLVTANAVALAGAIDLPFTIESITLATNDLGPATVQAYVEMVIFDSDPTAGVAGGNNSLYQQTTAGVVGIFAGTFDPATGYFVGGSRATLVPARGTVRHIMRPGAGTQTVWWQLKTLSGFTPSAPSTSWTPIFEGFRGRV